METDDDFDADMEALLSDEAAFYERMADEADASYRWHMLGQDDHPLNVNSREFDAVLLRQFDDVPF